MSVSGPSFSARDYLWRTWKCVVNPDYELTSRLVPLASLIALVAYPVFFLLRSAFGFRESGVPACLAPYREHACAVSH